MIVRGLLFARFKIGLNTKYIISLRSVIKSCGVRTAIWDSMALLRKHSLIMFDDKYRKR